MQLNKKENQKVLGTIRDTLKVHSLKNDSKCIVCQLMPKPSESEAHL